MRRRIVLSLAGVLATLLALELLLRVLPASTATMSGYYFDPDLLTYPARHRWTISTGWDLRNPQSLASNNFGFAADNDFVPNPKAVALVGDSFVEASMLDAPLRPGAQLEVLLGGTRPVYAFGSPGTSLLDYAQRVRFASERFGIRDFVIWLERGDAVQALCGSGNVQSRCLNAASLEPRIERRPEPTWLKRIARHSALAQYLSGQLKLRGNVFLKSMLKRSPPDDAEAPTSVADAARSPAAPESVHRGRRVVEAVLENFFAQAGPYLVGRTIFIVDDYRGEALRDPKEVLFQRQYLIDSLRARGVEVVDLAPVYRLHKDRSPLSLDVGPYDGHLNALGVQLVMEQVASRLKP